MEKAKCLLNGKTWNDEKCSCSCPKNTWTPCTTGYVFDSHDTCSCLRIQELVVAWAGFGDSCNNFLALVVALFILFTLIASAIIFHIKYHQYRMIKSRICKKCHDNLFLSKFAASDLQLFLSRFLIKVAFYYELNVAYQYDQTKIQIVIRYMCHVIVSMLLHKYIINVPIVIYSVHNLFST